jgi:type II secretory ATPase GspE/PulE/Tfp pilus assembly ATPase PilB-like protein
MHLESTLPIVETFTPEYLEYYGMLPLEVADGALRVAAARTLTREVLADLEETFGAPAELVEVASGDLTEALRILFANAESTHALVRSLRTDDAPAESLDVLEADVRDLANQPPVVRYVNLLIKEAHEARASDIHVEATVTGPRVRFRIDGVLTSETAPPRSIQSAVVSRLKLIADLDIAERRVPQDGRIRIRLDARDLDLRVSTVPTLFGESIVLRLLDQGGAPDGLAALGMPDGVYDAFAMAAQRAHGIVLATGPTGSGKTTTLYAALQLRDAEREKLITVEDPVEYRLPSVTQMPVNRKAGMTFAAGLRSILRQDPDVIMVGEMRDAETARIAVQAAMTGHLVFSTVHTNDAASAVTRLIDLDVEPYMLAATLQGVLAQRLVRRVCNHCAVWSAPGESMYALSPAVGSDQQVRSGHGCAICRHTGFRGRVGIFEFLTVDDEIRASVAGSASELRIREVAQGRGMSGMRDDGRAKVCQGLTTPEEVLRAIQV